MNRWIVVLLLCVALYVGIILVKGLTTVVEQPDRRAQQQIRTQAQKAAHPTLVVRQMSDSVGNTIVTLGLDFGDSPPALRKEPTFEIRNADGKKVYQGRFEFG